MISFKHFIKESNFNWDKSSKDKIPTSSSGKDFYNRGLGITTKRSTPISTNEKIKQAQSNYFTRKRNSNFTEQPQIKSPKTVPNSLSHDQVLKAFDMRSKGIKNMEIAIELGVKSHQLTNELIKHKDQPYYVHPNTPIKESERSYFIYNPTESSKMSAEDIQKLNGKDPHPRYAEHLNNLYTLQKLQKQQTDPNKKLQINLEMDIAKRKMQFWKTRPKFDDNEAMIISRSIKHKHYPETAGTEKTPTPESKYYKVGKDGKKLFGV